MSDLRQYLRTPTMPHILCPGCAHGIVLRSLLLAVERLQLDPDRLVVVAGIGCSSRLAGYVDFCTMHTTHGRAIAFATGVKAANPDLTVVVLTGDGDGLAIGGNHLIHAARRNVDLTVLLFNNQIYGMTGGQLAPTTPQSLVATTAPYGNLEPPFDACRLAEAAGATFVARGVAYEPLVVGDVIAQAIAHRGFSLVEVMTDCPEYFGRQNRRGKGPEMLVDQKRHAAAIHGLLAAKRHVPHIAAEADGWAWSTGILHQSQRPEFTAAYGEMARQVSARPAAAADADGLEPLAAASPAAGRTDVRIAGSGGQGVVLAGIILAEAAILQGRNAACSQVYGPASRGGASRSDVVMDSGPIDYPRAERLNLLVALTQEAADRYAPDLVADGTLVVDSLRVTAPPAGPWTCHCLPLLETARTVVGNPVTANIVALGATAALTGVVDRAALERAVARRAPRGSVELNRRALAAGWELGAAAGSRPV